MRRHYGNRRFGRDENGELNGYVASAKTVVYMLDVLKVINLEPGDQE